jgi:hypothetical protein
LIPHWKQRLMLCLGLKPDNFLVLSFASKVAGQKFSRDVDG